MPLLIFIANLEAHLQYWKPCILLLAILTHNASLPTPPTRSHGFYEDLINQSPKVNTTNYPLLWWNYLFTTGTRASARLASLQ